MFKYVSEAAAAKYYPRWYLLNFALGVDGFLQHTFQSAHNGFGILREDFTPRLAYYTIGRIMALFDSTWQRSDDVEVEFSGGEPLPAYPIAFHPDQGG